MEPRKEAIMAALGAFVRQRSGMEFGNYGDVKSFRAEQRSITKDLHQYRELAKYVQWHDTITADMLLEAARSAYSGRLTLNEYYRCPSTGTVGVDIDYCTGQYFPTEYRRAACAVLASAIWAYWREQCMPETEQDEHSGQTLVKGVWQRPGDWLRANARREFHRGIASRWFD